MNFVIGGLVVALSVLGGYYAIGGNPLVLWQPFEIVIIVGSALGAFIIANPSRVLAETGRALIDLFRGPRFKERDYLELLAMLYTVFRQMRGENTIQMQNEIENPQESKLFRQFPRFLSNETGVIFLTDYLRLISLGSNNPHELEALMDEEIETKHKETHRVSKALDQMAESFPALGIVAAVMGMIKTMGHIAEPPEILGAMIAGALVGTFLGVLLSYGFVGPLASNIRSLRDSESKYLQCIRAGLLAHVQGYAPAIAAEYARKVLYSEVQPSFNAVERVTTAASAMLSKQQNAKRS